MQHAHLLSLQLNLPDKTSPYSALVKVFLKLELCFFFIYLFILSFISDKNNLKITNKSKNNLQIDNKILCTYMKKLKNKNIKTVFIERIKSEVVLSVKLFT